MVDVVDENEIVVVEVAAEIEEQDVDSQEDENAEPLTADEISSMVEAIIFAHGSPIDEEKIGAVSGLSENEIAEAILALKNKYSEISGGIELVRLGDKYQFRTKSFYAPILQKLKEEKPKRLSPAALETLAVIAYRQPIIKSDIEGIRGVDATPTVKTLLDRNLIKIVGHQSTVGNPALYATTDEFLKLFSLGSLAELPTLRDLAPLDEDPGETAEQDSSSDVDNQSAGQEDDNSLDFQEAISS
jgi:segregation and condensation protein B